MPTRHFEAVETLDAEGHPMITVRSAHRLVATFHPYAVGIGIWRQFVDAALARGDRIKMTNVAGRDYYLNREETWSRIEEPPLGSEKLYALVGPDGMIVFQKTPDAALNRLPVLAGPADKVSQVIKQWASLHRDGVSYYLPNVARARDQSVAISALIAYRTFLEGRLKELP